MVRIGNQIIPQQEINIMINLKTHHNFEIVHWLRYNCMAKIEKHIKPERRNTVYHDVLVRVRTIDAELISQHIHSRDLI